jgi:undecaprenyl-diphosphatase
LSNLDYQIFHAINNLAGKFSWLDSLGVFLAVDGIYVMMVVAVILAIVKIHKKPFIVAFISSVLSSLLLVKIIKVMANRPRPFEVLEVNQLLADFGSGQAFSSGHAAVMFSIAFSFYGTKYFWPFLIWATVCSFSRVFVGVHYPGDVVASILISAFMVWLVRHSFVQLLKTKKTR